MTRTRRSGGRIVFVGAGPGDPGLLTVRSTEVLRSAGIVVTDPEVPAEIVAMAGSAEVQPALGEAADVAKSMVASAKSGATVVRLVAGDVLTADAVVKELQAVARTSVPFDVVPGIAVTSAAAGYAGIPVGSVHTVADVRSVSDWATLAGAPGTLLLHAGVGHLAETAASLAEAGVAAETPASVTAGTSLPSQRTVDGTLAGLDGMGRDLTGPLVVAVGGGAAQRSKLSWWESRALYGWRVLIPQTRDSADEMAGLLRGHGAIPDRVPTIAVEPPRTPAQVERAVKGLVDGRYQWVVFTSINSVRAVWEKFVEYGLDARAFSGVRIACVDEVTAEAVRALGITPDLVSAQPEFSVGLLDDFPEYDDLLDPVNRVLLPRADIATETLAEGLRERGWEIDDVTAYRTVRAAPPPAPTREAIKSGGFEAVCFTSASTVRNLVGIAGKPHSRTIVACLGPKTAETAREFGLRVDVQPEVPEIGALVDALVGHAERLRAEGALPPPRKTPRRR
ncbi:bifunctional uroporphyrinogen-III C-methyltransferase/uroporphyrinogen-III synthase [Nakamurella sp. YIM 132087]|uniref:Bifunctional uroporphyrinogen-III C-methyltransferase/uroporphyrinogen-III synthase n=1 Tax=Nakamurella alba TaxID=2665158 RepID=A0A7K1FNY2_9ACTN|nr:bifunctional uroporphyrinogen-III C-methyltransferase/uroporphyrinogen-III synthase [Nakamurella alba]MTD14504.1 bifunctional uroporphyrinogen-III C-methyltransferase/uroporphyrinogen-III synthase [Nakamurella alba]